MKRGRKGWDEMGRERGRGGERERGIGGVRRRGALEGRERIGRGVGREGGRRGGKGRGRGYIGRGVGMGGDVEEEGEWYRSGRGVGKEGGRRGWRGGEKRGRSFLFVTLGRAGAYSYPLTYRS